MCILYLIWTSSDERRYPNKRGVLISGVTKPLREKVSVLERCLRFRGVLLRRVPLYDFGDSPLPLRMYCAE